jgi:transcriptional regulator with XRE-family HTH domain
MATARKSPNSALDGLFPEVGRTLKRLRRSQRLSLRELADRAGVSPSFLSQIELEQVSPTIKNLEKICRALETRLTDFLRPEPAIPEPIVVRHAEQESRVAMRWSKGALQQLLPSDAQNQFTALLLTLKPSGRTAKRADRISLKELGVVMRGRVLFQTDTTTIELKPGDSIYFDLIVPHEWRNKSRTTAEILLVNPHFFHLFEQDEENLRARKAGHRYYAQ